MHWRQLRVWVKAHELVLAVYRASASFPKEEMFGITSQLRRAACSVAANIVEGNSRNSTREYLQFLFNARGSLEETRYFLMLSKDLCYVPAATYTDLESKSEEISKMLNGLIKSLKSSKE